MSGVDPARRSSTRRGFRESRIDRHALDASGVEPPQETLQIFDAERHVIEPLSRVVVDRARGAAQASAPIARRGAGRKLRRPVSSCRRARLRGARTRPDRTATNVPGRAPDPDATQVHRHGPPMARPPHETASGENIPTEVNLNAKPAVARPMEPIAPAAVYRALDARFPQALESTRRVLRPTSVSATREGVQD